MAVFFRAYTLYTVFDGFCFLEGQQGMTTLPTDMHANSLRFNWRYHSSHVGDDGPAATHTYRLGSVDATPGVGDDGIAATHTGRLWSVDATPGACAPDLHLVGLATHAFAAQVGDDSTATTYACRLGSVDATPGAYAPGLHLVGQAVHAFAAQVGADGTTPTHACRLGSVDATPGACAPDLHLVGLATRAFAAQVGNDNTASTHDCRMGSVDTTPGACAPGLHLVGQVDHASAAQVGADGTTSTHTRRLGSVDATPGACAPGLHIVGQAVHAFAAKVGDDGTTTTHTCRQGSVDATPGACASGLHLVGQADHIFAAPAARQVDAGGSVDATPRQLAQFHKYPVLRLLFAQVSGSVAATPDNSARALECRVPAGRLVHKSRSGQQAGYVVTASPHAAGTSASLTYVHSYTVCGAPWNTSDSKNGIDPAVAALNQCEHRPVRTHLLGTPDMSSSPKPVTAYLQQINELVCAAGPLPVADEWAPIFRGLDQAWNMAHQQALTTQSFLSTLSTFMMVKGQIPPSSREADHVRDIAHSVAKVRLGMMLDKGPSYGLGQEDRTQAQTEGTRCTATSTTVANAPLLVPAADLLPPTERLAALEMAIANLEQTEPDGTSALCTALAETEEAPQARSTDSLGGALSHRLARVSCLSLSPDTFLQVIPLTRPGRLAVLRTAAHCPARWAADSFAEYGSEVVSTDRSCLQRQGKGSGLGLLPECAQRSSIRFAVIRTPSFYFTPCGHHCALGRAKQGPRFRPTCHTPSISRNFQVPSEWLGYSRCWTRIPGILQRMQCQKPLHPASYQPVLLYCCQLSPHKVPYRTRLAARLRQGRGATTVGWVCSNGMPLGRRSRCTGMPIQSRQGRMRHRLPPDSSRAGVVRQAGSFELDPCAHYSAPHRALPTLKSSQVRVAAMPRAAYSARGDQAGPLTALLPADLDHELLRLSCVYGHALAAIQD